MWAFQYLLVDSGVLNQAVQKTWGALVPDDRYFTLSKYSTEIIAGTVALSRLQLNKAINLTMQLFGQGSGLEDSELHQGFEKRTWRARLHRPSDSRPDWGPLIPLHFHGVKPLKPLLFHRLLHPAC